MLLFYGAHIPALTDCNDWDLHSTSLLLLFPIYFLSVYIFFLLRLLGNYFEVEKKVPCLGVFYTPSLLLMHRKCKDQKCLTAVVHCVAIAIGSLGCKSLYDVKAQDISYSGRTR